MSKLDKKAIGMTLLVVLLLLLTGALRFSKSGSALLNMARFLLLFGIYIGMLSAWALSLRRRMMHSHIRGYLLGTAALAQAAQVPMRMATL